MFSGCTALSYVRLPRSVVTIDKYAFNSCTALSEVIFPPGVTRIGELAFGGCPALSSAFVPTGGDIHEDAFHPTTKVGYYKAGESS